MLDSELQKRETKLKLGLLSRHNEESSAATESETSIDKPIVGQPGALIVVSVTLTSTDNVSWLLQSELLGKSSIRNGLP